MKGSNHRFTWRALGSASARMRARTMQLLVLAVLLAASNVAAAAIAFVQTNNAIPQTPQTTVSVTFTAAQSAGNLNVVAIGWYNTTSNILSVTDSRGNNYVVAAPTTTEAQAGRHAIYYAANILSAAASANTVTVTFDGAVPYPDLRIAEYSGLDTANPLDVTISGTGSGATSSSGAITTTNANDVLVGANYVTTSTSGAGSGFTSRVITNPNGSILEDRIVTATGSYSATAPLSSGNWIMQMVALRAATGGGDATPPSTPGGLTANTASSTQINLAWSASTDNVGVTGYQIERCSGPGCSNFAALITVTTTSYSNTGLTPSTSYSYRVRATDGANNLSGYSATASATTSATPDTTAPTAPTNLAATPATQTQVNLSWTASTDNVGVTGYQLESCTGAGCTNFTQIATPAGTTFSHTGLTANTTYRYRVRATDAAGNLSAYSSIATATTPAAPDTQAPTAPGSLSAGAASSVQINLSWAASTDNVGVTGYQIERCSGPGCSNFAPLITVTTTSYSDIGLTPLTSYSYRVRATDGAGNLSSYSATASATTSAAPDTTAPTAPTNLAATPSTQTQVNLSWTASTDNVGVTGYQLESCTGSGCSNFAQIATPAGTTFSHTGLTANTTYRYRVRATDAAGNLSAYSSIATATTPAAPDTQAPTAPASLTATAASSAQINLGWAASTDNVGVTGYQIERCSGPGCSNFAALTTVSTTTYSNTGLAATTSYSYRVRATDAAGNLSAYSNTATATTLTGGTPATITFKQSNSAIPQSPQTTVSATFTAAQTAGGLNVIAIGWFNTTSNVLSVTDTRGNNYVLAAPVATQAQAGRHTMYYAANIVAAGAGANTVTVTFDGAVPYPDLRIAEYSGIDPSTPLDGAVSATGSSATSSSGTLTTTNANDLLVAGNYVTTGTTGAGTGFTQRIITDPDGSILEDRIVSATGSYSATAPMPSGGWVMQMAAFRAATGSGGDTTPPSTPTNLTANVLSQTQINLSWSASTDDVAVTGYQLERCAGASCSNFAQIATPTNTSFGDSGLTAGTTYRYRVRATDAAANLSAYSSIVNATTTAAPDTQPPTVTITSPTSGTTYTSTTTPINLGGTASDNVAVTLVSWSNDRGGSGNATGTTSWSVSGIVLQSGANVLTVTAADAAGNSSTDTLTVTYSPPPPDTTSPSAPGSLAATAPSSTQVNLSWAASTDNVGVTGYQVERCSGAGCANFALLASVATASYSDTGVTASTSYSYRVRATDAAGNFSGYSNTAIVTTPAGGTPATITYRQGNNAVPQTSQSSVAVTFTAAQTAGNLNVVAVGWFNTTSSVTAVTDSRGNNYVLAAGPTTLGAAGSQVMYYAANIGAAAAGANVVTVTFSAPAPYPDVRIAEYSGIDKANPVDVGSEGTGSSATSNSGSVPTSNANDLLVGANYVSTSTSGAGTGFTQRMITNPDGSILEDRVVSVQGTYSATAPLSSSGAWIMQMVAFRAAIVGGGTDTTPPTAPATLNANAVSSTQINLSWSASTDNTGVTAYQVERCTGSGCSNFALQAIAPDITYSNTGLTASTSYSYRVRATDADGNLSGYSPVASATTQASGGDTQPPTISITAPSGGATLTGTATFTASATDSGTGVQGVQFQVDGIAVSVPDNSTPYSVTFNTAQMGNGSHAITAYAWDGQRNIGTSAAVNVTFSNTSPANPSVSGFWTGQIPMPLVTVHLNLMPNGRVLTWDQQGYGYPDPVVWDPVTSSYTVVPVGDGTNLFCAGHTILPDGRVFAAGGNIATHVGTATGRIFNPATNLWSATPDMTQGRWYPTLTLLANGKVLTLSGEMNCQFCYALIPEVYDPATNTWAQLNAASKSLPWYPHANQLADGRVIVTGTSEKPFGTWALDVNTQTWTTVDANVYESGSAIMYAAGKFLQAGTSTDSNTNVPSTAVARVLDMNAASKVWRTVASMAFPRAYHVLTQLPDGNVLVTGGGRTTGLADIPNAVYQAEMWSPTTETWTTLASAQSPRLYHGAAILLPDARVMVSGGGRGGTVQPTDQLNTEIFSPPYLFKGARPTITSAPGQLTFNQPFSVQTPDAASVSKVVLIPLGSMTHAFNQNQRYVPLAFSAGAGTLTVTAPASTAVAPPGWYMLFLVNTNGVPSVAAILRL